MDTVSMIPSNSGAMSRPQMSDTQAVGVHARGQPKRLLHVTCDARECIPRLGWLTETAEHDFVELAHVKPPERCNHFLVGRLAGKPEALCLADAVRKPAHAEGART